MVFWETKNPVIPPLFDNGEIITDYKHTAEVFNEYFAAQCTPFDDDKQPSLPARTPTSLSSLTLSNELILDIIRSLNPNKSSGTGFRLV